MRITTAQATSMAMCAKNLIRVEKELEGRITKHVTQFTCLGNTISEYKSDIEIKMHKYDRLKGMMKRPFGSQRQ